MHPPGDGLPSSRVAQGPRPRPPQVAHDELRQAVGDLKAALLETIPPVPTLGLLVVGCVFWLLACVAVYVFH